ncbi:MAG: Spy/CpxP family protein refolding chaperone [Colwellia sp.]|nr:Spy/CpxP family protein refolding chaperone [Colwellia sp.]
MKNKLSLLLVSTLFVMSLSSNTVFAKEDHVGHNMHRGESSQGVMQHKFKKIAKFLALTKEQRTQVKVIHQQAKESRGALKPSLESFHQQSRTLVMAEQFDEQAFINLQRQFQDSFAQMALIKVKTKHSFMQILTEEQKDKMMTMKKSRMRGNNFSE